MKETNIPWLGKIPDNWKICRFKDIAVSKKEIVGEKAEDYERLALTLSGVIKRGKDDDKGLQPTDFYSYQILNAGDFIFKMIDLQNVSTSRVGLSPFTGLVSPAYVRFVPNSGTNQDFYYFYLMSLYYQKVYNNIAGDGVRSALNAGDLGLIVCPIPPKEEQIKIVKAIKSKEEKIKVLIANEEKQIEKLKAYKQALISEVVTKGLDPNVPMKDSGVEWIGEIPANWSVIKIKLISETIKEKYISGVYPYLALENVESFSGNYVKTEKNIFYSLNDTIVSKKGDVLFGKLRPYLGKSFLLKEDMCVSSEFAVFRCNNILSSELFHLMFLSPNLVDFINATTYGTKMPRANIDTIRNIYVPIMSHEVQLSINRFIYAINKKLDSLVKNKNQTIEKLKAYRQSMIYEYVTGKRGVY